MGRNLCSHGHVQHSNAVLGKTDWLDPEKFSELETERAIGRDE